MGNFDLFWLMTRKNFIVIRRSPIWTFFEVIAPLIFGVIIAYYINTIPEIDVPRTHSQTFTWEKSEIIHTNRRQKSLFKSPPFYSTRLGVNATIVQSCMQKLCDGPSCPIYQPDIGKKFEKMENETRLGILFTELDPLTRRLAYEFHVLEAEEEEEEEEQQLLFDLPKIQIAIESEFLQIFNVSPIAKIKLDTFTLNKGARLIWVDLFTFFPLIYFVLLLPTMMHMGREITAEKESGMKDFLAVMGLKPFNFLISHIFLGCVKGWLIVTFVSFMFAFKLWGMLKAEDNINLLLFFIPIYLHVVAGIIFAALVASCFKTSNSTIKAIAVLHPCLVALTFWNLEKANVFSPRLAAFSSLNYNSVLANVFAVIASYLKRSRRLNFGDIFEQGDLILNIGPLILLLILDIIWMSLLLWASECFQQKFMGSIDRFFSRKGQDQINHKQREEEIAQFHAIEKLPERVEIDVEVKNLSKRWESTGGYAVCDMNLQACRGEMTVLLGHNGAGKSTTFGMICGITNPTSGEIKVKAEQIGFCPQENSLFEKLTVAEHLWFFHAIKRSKNDLQEEMKDLLGALKIADKASENVMKLSGGMKRKLCLAMALIGNSRVVLLDEPTAGIDVGARSDVQRMLNDQKKHRTMILTTHYMDEAEALGDRIAIMVKGRCVAAGSPEFLKDRFDTGYILTCVLKDEVANSPEKTNAFIRELKELAPKARFDESKALHGKQVEITLPMKMQDSFTELFRRLEKSDHISTFGLSINNLEQVFLKVGELTDGGNHLDLSKIEEDPRVDEKNTGSFARWLAVFKALVEKRIYFSFHNWHQAISQFLVPILLVALTVVFLKTWGHNKASTKGKNVPIHALDFTSIGPAKFFVAGTASPPYSAILDDAKRAKNLKVMKIEGDDHRSTLEKQPNDLPLNFLGINIFDVTTPTLFTLTDQEDEGVDKPLMVLLNSLTNSLLKNSGGGSISVSYLNVEGEIVFDGSDSLLSMLALGLTSVIVYSMLCSPFAIFYVIERVSKFWHQQQLTGIHPIIIHLTSILFDFATFLLMSFFICIGFYFGGWTSGYLSLCLLLFAYFFATIANIYLFSSFFSSSSKANVLIMIYQTIGAYGSMFIMSAVLQFAPKKTDNVAMALEMMFPSFGLCWGIWALRSIEDPMNIMEGSEGLESITIEKLVQDAKNKFWLTIQLFFLSGFIQFVIVILWRASWIRYKLTRLLWRYPKNYRPIANEDCRLDNGKLEVAMEEGASDDPKNNEVLELNRVSKKYGNHVAIKELTMEVKEGECFGLLGVNGAGKTTTFGLITGEQFANDGHVKLNGKEVMGIKKMGYCPQFDAFMGDMTGKEVLYILAALYGYKYPRKKADSILKAVGMEIHADKQLKYCSGGQKRKISVGIALLADCALVILDEPTAGIDPKARREIWSLIEKFKVREDNAVLLCSHSMDECEALCNRIGILVQGKLKALGTPQELKSQYGNSYELTLIYSNDATQPDGAERIKTANEHPSAAPVSSSQRLVPQYEASKRIEDRDIELDVFGKTVQEIVKRKNYFPEATMRTDGIQHNILHFTVPRAADDRWSNLWERGAEIARITNATNYSIAQNTLLQTFLLLSQPEKAD